jgi:hypothetical protein
VELGVQMELDFSAEEMLDQLDELDDDAAEQLDRVLATA